MATTKQVTAHEATRTLSASELDAVSGGMLWAFFVRPIPVRTPQNDTQGGQNDPAQMFQQILQQLTQGG